jgi:ribulose 1,5-bisphosphate synthetase/thiazole synthase
MSCVNGLFLLTSLPTGCTRKGIRKRKAKERDQGPGVRDPWAKGEAMTNQARLIIVGGSAAGPSAAAKAKRTKKDLEVTIFERGDFVSYGA